MGGDVRLARPMTAFTACGPSRVFLGSVTGEMRVLEELRPNIGMTDAAGLAAYKTCFVSCSTGRKDHTRQGEPYHYELAGPQAKAFGAAQMCSFPCLLGHAR
jgi:hypothetical protein